MVFAVALVVVLDNLGVNVTGLVAGLGVGGIAIGLAAQGIFADLFAALAIIFDRPFRRGDSISYDTTSGSVEAIGLKSTRIRGIDGEERVISNKNLLNKEILNNTQRNHRRAKFVIGVTYSTPPEVLLAHPRDAEGDRRGQRQDLHPRRLHRLRRIEPRFRGAVRQQGARLRELLRRSHGGGDRDPEALQRREDRDRLPDAGQHDGRAGWLGGDAVS